MTRIQSNGSQQYMSRQQSDGNIHFLGRLQEGQTTFVCYFLSVYTNNNS